MKTSRRTARSGEFLKRFIAISLFAVVLFLPGFSVQKDSGPIGETVFPLIRRVVDSFNPPGLAVGIVKDGRIVYTAAFGVRNIESRDRVTIRSLFHMASVSKPFTATAIMQFVERGRIGLDDPVVKHLPYFKLADERYRGITIRQMLGHISGMPDLQGSAEYQWDKPEYDEGAAERYVRSLAGRKLIAAPGEKLAYSNIAFEVLGDLIAKVSGRTFEDYMKTYILEPAGMKDSTFLKKDVPPGLATSPHIMSLVPAVSDIYPYHRAHAPSSTLHSNIEDMCRWAIINLNKGILDGKRILKPESYDILWEPARLNDGSAARVGLSWFLTSEGGTKVVSHDGGDVGFVSGLCLIPEKSLAAVVLTNCDFAPASLLAVAVALTAAGIEPPSLPNTPASFPLGRTIADKGVAAAVAQYRELKARHADSFGFFPDDLDGLGYQLIGLKRIPEAIKILQLNAEAYPGKAFCYESLGEAYLLNGDRKNAILSYEQALKIDPARPLATEALKKLRVK